MNADHAVGRLWNSQQRLTEIRSTQILVWWRRSAKIQVQTSPCHLSLTTLQHSQKSVSYLFTLPTYSLLVILQSKITVDMLTYAVMRMMQIHNIILVICRLFIYSMNAFIAISSNQLIASSPASGKVKSLQTTIRKHSQWALIGPIPWGHSGPLCHTLSLLSLSSSSLSWTSMHRWRTTVPLATSGELAWGGSQ